MKRPEMNITSREQRTTTAEEVDVNWLETKRSAQHSHHAGHSGHRWMMIACCIPIVVIAVTLARQASSARDSFSARSCAP